MLRPCGYSAFIPERTGQEALREGMCSSSNRRTQCGVARCTRPPRTLLTARLLTLCSAEADRSGRLSPLLQAADFLWVLEHARRAGVQLHEELGKLVLREQHLQEALDKDVDQPAVQRLVLEHVEDTQDALSTGVRPNDVLQLVWWPKREREERFVCAEPKTFRMRILEVGLPGMIPKSVVLAATLVLMRVFVSLRGGVSARIPLGQ